MRIYYAHMKPASTRKTPTNVSVRADLVRRAKELGLNLSGLLEAAIEHAIREAERADWLAKNQDGVRSFNVRVEKHGGFWEPVCGVRLFRIIDPLLLPFATS